MSTFLVFYLNYVRAQSGSTFYFPFFKGAIGHYLDLVTWVGALIFVFYLTQSFHFLDWLGWITLGWAVLLAYIYLVWEPVSLYRQPVEAKQFGALKDQTDIVVEVVKGFYKEAKIASSKGKKPNQAAKKVVKALNVYHDMFRSHNYGGFSAKVEEIFAEEAQSAGTGPLALEMLGREDVPVPTKLRLTMELPSGDNFTFTRSV